MGWLPTHAGLWKYLEQFQQMYSPFAHYMVKIICEKARFCHTMSFANDFRWKNHCYVKFLAILATFELFFIGDSFLIASNDTCMYFPWLGNCCQNNHCQALAIWKTNTPNKFCILLGLKAALQQNGLGLQYLQNKEHIHMYNSSGTVFMISTVLSTYWFVIARIHSCASESKGCCLSVPGSSSLL